MRKVTNEATRGQLSQLWQWLHVADNGGSYKTGWQSYERIVISQANSRWAGWLGHRRVEYRANCSCVRLFARKAYSFAGSPLLTLLPRTAALICSFACSLTHSLLSSWEKGFCPWNERVDFIYFHPIVQLMSLTMAFPPRQSDEVMTSFSLRKSWNEAKTRKSGFMDRLVPPSAFSPFPSPVVRD